MYNNYNPYLNNGFNPNFRPMQPQSEPQYVPQTTFTKPTGLQGKQVDSVEVVKATDVPFDGSISYFPLTDNSAIVTKQLLDNGSSKITIFKPVKEQNEDVTYITRKDLEKALNDIDLSELDDIKQDIREIKKQLKKKGE